MDELFDAVGCHGEIQVLGVQQDPRGGRSSSIEETSGVALEARQPGLVDDAVGLFDDQSVKERAA
jgi:hypothetical protein